MAYFYISFLVISIFFSTANAADENLLLGRFDVANKVSDDVVSQGLYASRNTYGMRKNAVVAAFQANPSKSFNYPILGLTNLKSFADYGDRDSVSLYADNTSQPFGRWEIISNAKFDGDSVESDSIDSQKIKVGMLLTSEDGYWSGIVNSISKGKIITDGWINVKTKKIGHPQNGTKIFVNPITKIWVANFNSFIQENSRASNSVIQENGLINNKIQEPTAVNGIDTVILPSSKFGGTAAYLARGADKENKQQWLYGFVSQGSQINFLSSNSLEHAPIVGFKENSTAQSGIEFSGKNINNSIVWKKDDKVVAAIDPNGLIRKFGYKTQIIRSNYKITDDYARYIIDSKQDISISLPDENFLFDGFTLKIVKINENQNVTFFSKRFPLNKQSKFKLSGAWQKYLIFINGNWYLY